MIDKEEFIAELATFVKREMDRYGDLEYCTDGIEIADARNRIFRNVGSHRTDEEAGIYSLRELCMMNEEMEFEVNVRKIEQISRCYFDWQRVSCFPRLYI